MHGPSMRLAFTAYAHGQALLRLSVLQLRPGLGGVEAMHGRCKQYLHYLSSAGLASPKAGKPAASVKGAKMAIESSVERDAAPAPCPPATRIQARSVATVPPDTNASQGCMHSRCSAQDRCLHPGLLTPGHTPHTGDQCHICTLLTSDASGMQDIIRLYCARE